MNNKKLTVTPGIRDRKRPVAWLAAFFLTALLPLHSAAESADEPLKLITIEVAPWASVNSQSGAPEGAFITIVEEIAKRTGQPVDITLTPFARVERELEAGSQDCTILIPRDERIVTHGELVSYHPMGVIAHHRVALEDYDDLYDLRISLLRGSTITPQFDADARLRKEYDTDYPIALRKISRERVDAVAGAIPTILFLAAQEGLSDYLGTPLVLEQVPLIFQCSNNSLRLDVMDKINSAIVAMREDGTMAAIERKYNF